MQYQSKMNNNTNYASIVLSEIAHIDDTYELQIQEAQLQKNFIDSLNILGLKNREFKIPNLLSYENTKEMSQDDVKKYFPQSTFAQRRHINFMIRVSNHFSKNDLINKVIFEELRVMNDLSVRIEYSLGLVLEKENFLLGFPALHDVLIFSDEWIHYKKDGLEKGAKEGVFMNKQHQARYEQKDKPNYKQILLSHSEATEFLIEMFNLSKEKYEDSKGTVVEDDYKAALIRYTRMYQRYLRYLLK
ncbi:MAG: hypothetical protein HRT43_04845 [Campylobacteraceae bacterium]|nr:hypothetical protein [Campylobacteraceae bacterium]